MTDTLRFDMRDGSSRPRSGKVIAPAQRRSHFVIAHRAHPRERATASRQRAMRARRSDSARRGSKRRSTAHCAAISSPPDHTPVA
ncbi:MAG TPA: hypothetical protein PKC71_03780, partial [Ottowia sp.]|nr:hypothetical protein [Ottowia sp.]